MFLRDASPFLKFCMKSIVKLVYTFELGVFSTPFLARTNLICDVNMWYKYVSHIHILSSSHSHIHSQQTFSAAVCLIWFSVFSTKPWNWVLKHRLVIHICTGWRRPIGCLKLQFIFRKRATNYRALLRKMTYKDKASYGSSPICIFRLIWILGVYHTCMKLLLQFNILRHVCDIQNCKWSCEY